MKNYLITLSFLFLGFMTHGQTSLEKALESYVSINMPPFLYASLNDNAEYVIESSEKDSVPQSLAYTYYLVPALARDTVAFKTYFGKVNSIIRHKNGEYVVFVYVAPNAGIGPKFKYVKTDRNKVYAYGEIPFTRIKSDFRYGEPFTPISGKEAFDLDLMLTHCSRERAEELFNMSVVVTYPINLCGNVYENKYSVCRAVLAAKSFMSFHLYFMMTNDNYKNFDSYLDDFKHVFWWND